jgi:hypothetical protein
MVVTGITPAHAADATPLFISFEANDPLRAVSIGDPTFGGAATEVISSDNAYPVSPGDVLKFTKGNEPWSGTNLVPPATTPLRLADGTNSVITMSYFSNDAGPSPVQLRLQLGGATVNKVVEALPGMNQLSFDMSTGTGWNSTVEYDQLVIYPNFSTDDPSYTGAEPVTNSGQVYEIDNVSIAGGTSADLYVPQAMATSKLLTFEADDTLGANVAGDSSVDKPQGAFAGASTSIEDAIAGGNGGKALKIVKNVGGEVYAGANILVFETATTKITSATFKTVTFNYYSPKADSPLRVELAASSGPIGTTITAPQGWSRLVADFTDVVGWSADTVYEGLVMFPDFEVVAAGDIFYVDNIGINGATTPEITAPVTPREATSTLLTFETGDELGAVVATPPTPQKPQGGFEGAATSIDVAPAGGNGGNALKITKNVGAQVYAGATFIKFGTDKRVTNGTHKVITFNYYSPKDNSPVAVELRPYPNALSKTVNAPLGWSTMTFDFTDVAGWTADEEFTLLSIFPDFNQPAGDVAQSYYVDNLAFNGAVTPEIPAEPVVRDATSTLLTFEAADTLGAKVVGESTLAKPEGGFEGAVTTIENAPAAGNGGKALKIVKGVGAPTYAGVNIIRFGADKRVTNGTYKSITFNYYSPKTTSTVRVELRAFPNALGKTVNAPKGWSKITVDFSDVVGWTDSEEFVSVIMFPDFDVAGAGDAFYVDNLAFNGATTPAIAAPKVKPSVRAAASLSGTAAKVGKTLTARTGLWNGSAAITYTYKWYRCAVSATKAATSSSTPAKCVVISGATKSTYKVAKADIGKYVRALVSAKNSAGTAYSMTKTTKKKVVK